jgi:hypothetical protein
MDNPNNGSNGFEMTVLEKMSTRAGAEVGLDYR